MRLMTTFSLLTALLLSANVMAAKKITNHGSSSDGTQVQTTGSGEKQHECINKYRQKLKNGETVDRREFLKKCVAE